MMTALRVSVQQQGCSVSRLLGRSAAMIVWLVVYGDRINTTFRGSITFDWEGPRLRPQLHEKFDSIDTGALTPAST